MKETSVVAQPPDQLISIQQVQVNYHQYDRSQSIQPTDNIQYELQEIIRNIYQLGGLSSIQLPRHYYEFHFSPAVIPPPISPIGHPIEKMIVSIPQKQNEPARLYVKNGQNQWLEYRTTRSLHILLAQLQTISTEAN